MHGKRMARFFGFSFHGILITASFVVSGLVGDIHAQERPKQNLNTDDLPPMEANTSEKSYYSIVDIPTPPDAVLEAGSMLELPDGRIVIGTRRGEIYFATGLESTPPAPQWKLFATGLTEIFGLAWRDGVLYVTQQAELTRVIDTDGDGTADRFETVSDAWAWGGEHEYSFGSDFDKEGAIWTVHGLTDSYTSERLFRGWALRHFPDGRWEPIASGLRSPGGVGFNSEGDVFYLESQGPWGSACTLKQLTRGKFMGHPISNKWWKKAPGFGPTPPDPTGGEAGRRYLDAQRIPQLVLPSVTFPYKRMGQSASGLMLDASAGKFGAFGGQFFVGDYTLSLVMRAEMEKVNGTYQGTCYPFRQGFATGIIGTVLTHSGHVFVGGSKRGWPVRGMLEFALQRLDWTGLTPFEVLTTRIQTNGFEFTFTLPVDSETGENPKSYAFSTFTHHYYEEYGGPEIEQEDHSVLSATVSPDHLKVRLVVDRLLPGCIHEWHFPGVRSAAGQPLVHDGAYYTLNQLPK